MLTAQIESYAENLQAMQEMYPAHWEELALNKDKVPLDPDYPSYLARDRQGEILHATVREGGKIVGYFVGFIGPALHYRTCLTLTMDIFWVAPEARGAALAGVKLFRAVEAEARRRGVQRLFYGSKLHRDASRLFEYLGCEPVETFYSKWIGS